MEDFSSLELLLDAKVTPKCWIHTPRSIASLILLVLKKEQRQSPTNHTNESISIVIIMQVVRITVVAMV